MSTLEETLAHFGIKGMKWGTRRSQAQLHSPSEDHVNARAASAKAKSGGTKALSNKELQDLVTRMNLEKQFSTVNPTKMKKASKFLKAFFATGRTVNEAVAFANSPAGKVIREHLREQLSRK